MECSGCIFRTSKRFGKRPFKYQIPFNNISLVTPHKHAFGTYRDPTADELRFLVYTTLAYGGRGIMYFAYSSSARVRVRWRGNHQKGREEVETL